MTNKTFIPHSISFELTLALSHIRDGWLNIPTHYWNLFPDVKKLSIILDTNEGHIHTELYNYSTRPYFLAGKELQTWFKIHELKRGDKVRVTVNIQTQKYRLEIV